MLYNVSRNEFFSSESWQKQKLSDFVLKKSKKKKNNRSSIQAYYIILETNLSNCQDYEKLIVLSCHLFLTRATIKLKGRTSLSPRWVDYLVSLATVLYMANV